MQPPYQNTPVTPFTMRVISIKQSSGQFDDGLSEIRMERLKKIVILSGANGAGKSRLLKRVYNGCSVNVFPQKNRIGFEFDLSQSERPSVYFVSKKASLSDLATMTMGDIEQKASSAKYPGMEQIAGYALPYIQQVLRRWRNATHPDTIEDKSIVDQETSNYESLHELIQMVLGESLGQDLDNNPMLFGRKIVEADLSDGQKLLLQWCIALHAQGSELAELVLLMDEPENSLHPESLISTIDRIIEANDKGQIWIATHSVPLIAAIYKKHAADVSLYFMDSGEISYASEKPEEVLKSLMGGEQSIEALREFIDLPEVFATNRFAAQCLLPPEVTFASSSSNIDPQIQITNQGISDTSKKIKMLDFGCGKGRILESLLAVHGSELPGKLDYIGFDNSEENREQCEQVIKKAYQDSTSHWFSDRQLLAQRHPGKSFDRILLCNVLHEINPKEWHSLFDEVSIINQNLADSGELLIIEDYLMPKGEYAHPFGFIVLDTEALQALFASGSGDEGIKVEDGQNSRVRGHFIPKKLLANVTQDTIKAALKLAKRNAKEKIEKLRNPNNDRDFKSGREHGFWVQQYANTTLAIEQ
jgi:predicted ATPase